MAIKTGDNFLYRGKKPLDSRDSFDTILAMTTFAESSINEGHISYVKETDKYYKFNSTNEVDTTLGKWREYNGGGGSSTDEKVKLDATATDAKYLNELIDNATIEVDTTNNCLVVKKIDGQTATVAEINFLTGVTSNIQTQIDNLGKSMTMYGVFGTKADLLASTTPTPVDGNTAIVIADEDNNNKQMTYIYIASNSTWTQVAESSVTVRDFTTEPINLATETTGTLHKSKIDTAIARLADVLDKATYKGTGDGIVKQADKLTGLTATIAALNQAVTDSHTHSNKAVLDKIVSNGIGSGFLADNGKYISILHIGTTSPTYDSQIWIDNTDSSKPILKIFDGTNWVAISSASSGSGTSITVDTSMSSTSTNPVQNKVIKAYVDSKSVDISADSDNAIQTKTDGIYVEKTKISTDDGNALSKKSNGLFVQDLSNKVNALNIAQKTVNSELEYYYATKTTSISGVSIKDSNLINYLSYLTNITSNLEPSRYNTKGVTLKKSKTYRITFGLARAITSGNGTSAYVMDSDGNKLGNRGYFGSNSYSDNIIDIIYTPTKDISVYPALVNLNTNLGSTYYPDCSFFQITEIGREVIIDPVEYVDSTKGIEDTPVGHIIPYMGNNAPKHYLICDGGEYNISNYPYLAQHFKTEFGSYNYFGGDGITTFAVPDLRGEFLRGTGTNSHINEKLGITEGSGANVGEHQDATTERGISINTTGAGWIRIGSRLDTSGNTSVINPDTSKKSGVYDVKWNLSWDESGNKAEDYTSRPTNTSVLYCIKYEPTYFMKNTYNPDNAYSADETIVGYWIDGKPIYRKVETISISKSSTDVNLSSLNIKGFISVKGYFTTGTETYSFPYLALNSTDYAVSVFYSNGYLQIRFGSSVTSTLLPCTVYAVIEYTKTTD